MVVRDWSDAAWEEVRALEAPMLEEVAVMAEKETGGGSTWLSLLVLAGLRL